MSKRSALIREMKCIACASYFHPQPNATEEHHLNLGGKAGQKRRGDEFSIPLCAWHHRGEFQSFHLGGAKEMRNIWGPSLAYQSKQFRETYGTDDELLSKVNALIGNT